MNSPIRRLGLVASSVTVLVALATLPLSSSPFTAYAGRQVAPPDPEAEGALSDGASLHNPGFDNHDWYEFDRRYQSAYPGGAWLPDDDNNLYNNIPESSLQDWRLWFQDGTAVVNTDPEQVYVLFDEAVQIRPYETGPQLAGLYQVIYGTIPCLTYRFEMYGQSRPEGDDAWAALQVGIDQAGWHPDSRNDPAVHGNFPDTTVWGPSHNYKWAYGPLTATAEALGTEITVFTYADAPSGRYHRILWDMGSFQEATPDLISDPDNPPAVGRISNVTVDASSTTAQINWLTASPALGQVYYRLVSTSPTPVTPTLTLTPTFYLPMVRRVGSGSTNPWLSTPLNKAFVSAHSEVISGLQPSSIYEYFVASRGFSGGQCVTWISDKNTFTTANQ